ncbi:hypothetical protein LCGC14_2545540 [marine sediment metagenome]|uniref:Uncharacterized protein n=1 Tax=marine sediment metagenome TaxID=412755 RepID=A0A0F9DHI4_9ZZZZ
MVKLLCKALTYLPSETGGDVLERFEDERGEDIYDIPGDRVEEFLATGNFQLVPDSGEPSFQGGEIELSPDERACLQSLLPESSNAVTLGVILDLQVQLKTTGSAKTQPKIIDIGPQALEVINSEFRELNDQGELPLEWLQTYQRFN